MRTAVVAEAQREGILGFKGGRRRLFIWVVTFLWYKPFFSKASGIPAT